MKCISVNLLILLILFSMQSCVKEDNPDCKYSVLQLRFRYTLNDQYSDLFGFEVNRVSAYVFNTAGMYVGYYSEPAENLANNYIMTIPLPEGRYHAVVFCDNSNTFSAGWTDSLTNSFSSELQPGITSETDFRVMLNTTEGTDGYLTPQSVPGDLYAGYAADALSSFDTSHVSDVDLMKDTKNIIVKISGSDLLTRSVVVPDVYITAINGRYKNNNSIDTAYRMLKYVPYKTFVKENMVYSYLKTMRLVSGNAPMLSIKHPSISGYIFNRDITELILSNPKYVSQEDIDREDTFVFEINISQTGIISVSINGWKINSIVPAND